MLKNFKKICTIFLAGVLAVLPLTACGGAGAKDAAEIEKAAYSTHVSVHDPSIFKEDGTYYIFGSHMDSAKSTDLVNWEKFSTGVDSSNKLFDGLFESAAFDWVGLNEQGGYSVWAPDVMYNEKMGKYCMYFCTTSSWNKSSVCLATADAAEGPYVFQARLVDSGFKKSEISQTTLPDVVGEGAEDRGYCSATDYNSQVWPNAIDPAVFYDADGKLWMVYGSWSGGIFMLELDEATGLPIHPEDDPENGVDKYFGKHILAYGHVSCEGPYIMYDAEAGYYYLFVSYGSLTTDGGYQVRLYRSENPDGPYVDAAGEEWTGYTSSHGEHGLKLLGNYLLPNQGLAYMAPGHNSAFIDDDGRKFIIYHTRFDDGSEYHEPRVHQLFTNEDGWLVTAPFAISDTEEAKEEINPEGYSMDEMCGTYQMVSMGLDISNIVNKTKEVQFKKDGTIEGDIKGTWEYKEGTCYATLKVGTTEYKGVFVRQLSEAGQPVICFTGVSEANVSMWAVRYLEK